MEQHATADAGSTQNGAARPLHMSPCVCHCAACRAAGHSNGACVVLCAGLHDLFDGKADVVDLVLRYYYYGACGWGTARFDAPIRYVRYGPGDIIAAGGDDQRIHLLCAQTGERILCPQMGHTGEVLSVCFDRTGQRLASCGGHNDYSIRLWSTESGTPIGSPLTGHHPSRDDVSALSWSPDGIKLASGSNDKTVKIWNPATGRELCELSVDGRVDSIAFAPCGNSLAVASNNFSGGGSYSVQIFTTDESTGNLACQSTLRGQDRYHDHAIKSLSWSPDSTRLVTGSADGTAKIWNLATGEELCKLTGNTQWVCPVAWSPDGTKLASGRNDKTVKIWNPATGEQLWQLKVDGSVTSVVWSTCGSKIAAACNDHGNKNYTVRILSSELRACYSEGFKDSESGRGNP